MIQISTVNDISELSSLKDKWNNLLNKSKSDNIFLTHQWIFTWWRYFGAGKKLKIILVEDNKELIGIAPLMVVKNYYFLKTLKFVGDPHSDYLDFILLPGVEKKILDLIFAYLYKCNYWDVIQLKEIPQNSETIKLINEESIYKTRKTVESICPILNLNTNWDQLFNILSPKMRHNLKYYRNRLEREHKVSFEDIEKIDLLEENMNIMFELHQKRWADQGIQGVFKDINAKRFYLDIIQQFYVQNWLQLRVLRINENPVSICLNFKYQNRFYYYQSGRDPDWYKYSIGDILLADTIKYAIEQGFTKFDFLRGDEEYKKHWMTINMYNYSIELVNCSISSKVNYTFWIFNKWTIKTIKVLLRYFNLFKKAI